MSQASAVATGSAFDGTGSCTTLPATDAGSLARKCTTSCSVLTRRIGGTIGATSKRCASDATRHTTRPIELSTSYPHMHILRSNGGVGFGSTL
jgi:hypothetical protein